MKLLILDTSTTAFSAAMTEDGEVKAELLVNSREATSSGILRATELAVEHAGLPIEAVDAFAVTLGPGSFTGLRVGLATVKGLAIATGKPAVGFSSLAMLAMNLAHSAFPVCPMLDARKNEVYTALYRCGSLPEPIVGDCVISPADFLEHVTGPTLFVGSGAVRYRELIAERLGESALFPPAVCHVPRASSGAALAGDLFARGLAVPAGELRPLYIRPSEAELARRKMPVRP